MSSYNEPNTQVPFYYQRRFQDKKIEFENFYKQLNFTTTNNTCYLNISKYIPGIILVDNVRDMYWILIMRFGNRPDNIDRLKREIGTSMIFPSFTIDQIVEVILRVQKVLHKYFVDYTYWGEIFLQCITISKEWDFPSGLREYNQIVVELLERYDVRGYGLAKMHKALVPPTNFPGENVQQYFIRWIDMVTDVDTFYDGTLLYKTVKSHLIEILPEKKKIQFQNINTLAELFRTVGGLKDTQFYQNRSKSRFSGLIQKHINFKSDEKGKSLNTMKFTGENTEIKQFVPAVPNFKEYLQIRHDIFNLRNLNNSMNSEQIEAFRAQYKQLKIKNLLLEDSLGYNYLKNNILDLIFYERVIGEYPFLINGVKLDDIDWNLLGNQLAKYTLRARSMPYYLWMDLIISIQHVLLQHRIEYSLWSYFFQHTLPHTGLFEIGFNDNWSMDQLVMSIFYNFTQKTLDQFGSRKRLIYPNSFKKGESLKQFYTSYMNKESYFIYTDYAMVDVCKTHMLENTKLPYEKVINIKTHDDLFEFFEKYL